MHIRLRNLQVGKKPVRHGFVVMLTCVNQHVLQRKTGFPRARGISEHGLALVVISNRSEDRRRLHKIWPGAHDGEYLSCLGWFHVIHWCRSEEKCDLSVRCYLVIMKRSSRSRSGVSRLADN